MPFLRPDHRQAKASGGQEARGILGRHLPVRRRLHLRPTGHNVGAAMVEAMVYACNDDWDLAWDLMPEDDYLTGRLERYDEQTDQVIESGVLDGRTIRGVIYFVRLHKDIAEISARFKQKDEGKTAAQEAAAESVVPELEPARDPKRKKRKASKPEVRKLVEAEDLDALVDLAFDDIKVLWFMQRMLYDPDEASRWHTAHVIGQVCARLSTRQPSASATCCTVSSRPAPIRPRPAGG